MARIPSDGNKNQEPYVLSESQETEDFIEDDTPPSLFLEDIHGDKEVWILECPATIDPQKLLGKQLHFGHQSSITAEEVSKETIIVSPVREEGSVCCLLSSCSGDSINAVSLQYAGKLKLDLSCDLPCSEAMIPDQGSVRLPLGLKSRHPFLGSKFQNIVNNMKNSEENVIKVKIENGIQEKPEKKKKKKKSNSVCHEEIVEEMKDAVEEPTEPYVTHRKKKKHISSHQNDVPEALSFDSVTFKTERTSSSPIRYNDLMQNNSSWTNTESPISKKIKKEKDVSMVQNSNSDEYHQEKKKKKHNRNTDSELASNNVVEELTVMDSHHSKKSKKKKSDHMLINPILEESNEIHENKIGDMQHSKKKRKRHTMDNADIKYAHIMANEEKDNIVEENYVVPSKKKKKMESIPEDTEVLLSPKKEKLDWSDKITKIKKKKRKSCIPNIL